MNRSRAALEQKALLRKELRQKAAGLKAEERSRRSALILKTLFQHPKFLGAGSVLIYAASPAEVETRPIFEEARKAGKTVYVPLVDPAESGLRIMEFQGWNKLRPGAYGILEPEFDPKLAGNPESVDLAIVPGVGFDRGGGRLGRGEGYFDRFLKRAKRAYKIGLAFESQMVEQIPRDAEDILMDEVLIG